MYIRWQSWRIFVGSSQYSLQSHSPPLPPPPLPPHQPSSPSSSPPTMGKSKFKIFSKLKGTSKHSNDMTVNQLPSNTNIQTIENINAPPIPDSIDNSMIVKEKSHIVVVNDTKGSSYYYKHYPYGISMLYLTFYI